MATGFREWGAGAGMLGTGLPFQPGAGVLGGAGTEEPFTSTWLPRLGRAHRAGHCTRLGVCTA